MGEIGKGALLLVYVVSRTVSLMLAFFFRFLIHLHVCIIHHNTPAKFNVLYTCTCSTFYTSTVAKVTLQQFSLVVSVSCLHVSWVYNSVCLSVFLFVYLSYLVSAQRFNASSLFVQYLVTLPDGK